ncbi:hypothetical protein L1887_40418 [Cichorium endivia]|nr:hypothetical protein L1887_40418 [Cichorium endivia]
MLMFFVNAVNYEDQLEDGSLVAKSDGVEFKVEDDGFGEKGKPASCDAGSIPAYATLKITLELLSWKIVKNITDDKKVFNKILKEGEGYERPNERAIFHDTRWIEYDINLEEDEKKQTKSLKFTRNLNNAACWSKLKDYKQAKKLCTKVLELESTNVKALHMRAQEYINVADMDLAEIDIKKALEIDPYNKDVKLAYKVLKEKIKEYNKKDAKFYGNMFAKRTKSSSNNW